MRFGWRKGCSMVNKKMRCCLGLAFGLAAGAQAHETRVGALSPSQHADTEATTNVVFWACDSDDRLFRLALELNATADNNVSVVFGTDAKKVSSDHLVGGGNPVDSHVFEDLLHDWGSSDGRGFNEVTDTHSDIIRKCLMHGRDTGGSDIPYSKVEGFSSTSRHVFDTSKVSVGASNMRND